VPVDDGVAAGETSSEALLAPGRPSGNVHHPDARPGRLDDALARKQLSQRRLVHVSGHRLHGRAEPLQLLEEGERGQVAAVQDQIGRAELLDAGSREAPIPARQVRIGDDGEERKALLTGP
jgi:hypothetical protein